MNEEFFKKMVDGKLISVVMPCYNEEHTIGHVIDQINSLGIPNLEIIIVDDGSRDASVEIVKSKPNTVVYIHKKNQGYGKTLLDGIKKARGDLVVTIDSDGQHDPRDIFTLCKPILEDKADIVVGSRYKGKYYYRLPLVNRAGEAFIESLIHFIFGYRIRNNQGGFRVFNRRALKIFDDVKFLDMAFTTEILLKAFIDRLRVVEAPIHLRDRPIGKSRVKKIKLLGDILHCFTYYTIKYYKVWKKPSS